MALSGVKMSKTTLANGGWIIAGGAWLAAHTVEITLTLQWCLYIAGIAAAICGAAYHLAARRALKK